MGWAQSHLSSEILVAKVFLAGNNWKRQAGCLIESETRDHLPLGLYYGHFAVPCVEENPGLELCPCVGPQRKPVSHQLSSFNSLSILPILSLAEKRTPRVDGGRLGTRSVV